MNYTMIICSIIVISSVLFGCYQNSVAKTEKSKSELYEAQLQVLQIQSDETKKNFETAQKQALSEMIHIQDESKKIMKMKVSSNCESAMQWGIAQAKRMKQ